MLIMIIIISIINVNTKPCVFGAQSWWYQKIWRMSPKKWISSTKTALLGPKRTILWNRGHETARRAAKRPHTGIQSYLRIWGTYDPIESGLSKPRKGGFCGYNVKNLIWGPILAKKRALAPPTGACPALWWTWKRCLLVLSHDGSKKLEDVHKKLSLGPKTALLGPKRAILGNRGHETFRRAAKRPPTGKPKLSRVTSGYGGLVIPWVGSVWPQKMGVI